MVITGTNFGTGSGSSFLSAVWNVPFGGLLAQQFTVDSATQITAVTPPHAAGTIDVSVRTSVGQSSNTAADDFEYIADDPPSVTSLSVNTGYTTGGTQFTITGTKFTGATAVTFGSTPATYFHVNSATSILVVAPHHDAGTVDVRVTTNGGTSAIVLADQFTFTEQSGPTVTGLSPSSGGTNGGTQVIVTGTHFENVGGVTFGGLSATTFTVNSATSITATAPAHTAGTVDVIVSTIAGSSPPNNSARFTYSAVGVPDITAVSPSSGGTAGGTTVTITGTFLTGASSVLFGGTPATSFAVQSDTQITAVTPSHVAGTVHITVTTPSGTTAQTSADQFTYSASSAPTVTAISPTSGSTSGTTLVTLTGTGFASAVVVSFGSVLTASFTVLSDTTLTVLAPAQAAGTVHVRVTTRTGTSSATSADQFTYIAAPAPAILSVSPSSGLTTGGTHVMITGLHLGGASSVTFGTTPATSFSVFGDSVIYAVAPAAAAGTVDIRVTTPSGTSAVVTADHFTYTAAPLPTLFSLSITSGSTAGDDILVITGTNLADAYQINFGNVSASNFVVDSSTQLTVRTPAHAAGTVDVVVYTRAGSTATSSASRFTFTLASAPAITSINPSPAAPPATPP